METVKRIIAFVVLALTISGALAQSPTVSLQERLAQVRKSFDGHTDVHIRMTVKVFANEKNARPYYNQVAEIRRQGDNYSTHFGDYEMLLNDKHLIMVNKSARQVIVSQRSKETEKEMFQNAPLNTDSLFAMLGEPKLISSKDGIDHFSIDKREGAIKKIDLYLDTTSGLARRLDYTYEDGQFASISFDLMNTTPSFDEDTFSDEQYFSLVDGEKELNNHFAGYHLAEVEGPQKETPKKKKK